MTANICCPDILQLSEDEISKDIKNIVNSIQEALRSEDNDAIQYIMFAFQTVLPHIPIDELEKVLLESLTISSEEIFTNSIRGIENFKEVNLTQTQINPIDVCSNLLLICSQILQSYLCGIVHFKSKPVMFIHIKSFVFSTSCLLTEAWNHMAVIHNIYPEDVLQQLNSNLENFKKDCHELQAVLFRWIAKCIDFKLTSQEETDYLSKLASDISVGAVRSINLNVVYMVDIWKSSLTFFEKFHKYFKPTFDVNATIKCWCQKIIQDLLVLLDSFPVISKSIQNVLKIANFMLKVLVKLCRMFQDSLSESCTDLCNLLMILYRFSPRCLIQLKMPEEIVTEMDKKITVGADPLLTALISLSDFKTSLQTLIQKHWLEQPLPTLLLTLAFIKRSSITEEDLESIEIIFDILEIMGPAIIEGEDVSSENDLYESSLISTATYILGVDNEVFPLVETILLRNLLQPDPWRAMMSSDLWCLICRCGTDEILETTIECLIAAGKLLDRRSHRPELVYIEALLCRLFPLCDITKFLNKYPPQSNIFVWRIIGLSAISDSDIYASTIYDYWSNISNWINSPDSLVENYLNLEESLLALKDDCVANEQKPILESLWNLAMPSLLIAIASATGPSVSEMTPEECLKVTKQLNLRLVNANNTEKFFSLEMLKYFNSYYENCFEIQDELLVNLSSAFQAILHSNSIVLPSLAMDILANFFHHPHCMPLIQMTISPNLDTVFRDFLEKTSSQSYSNESCNQYPFSHRCFYKQLMSTLDIDVTAKLPIKKIKMDEEENIFDTLNDTIIRFQSDSYFITKHYDKLQNEQKQVLSEVCKRLNK